MRNAKGHRGPCPACRFRAIARIFMLYLTVVRYLTNERCRGLQSYANYNQILVPFIDMTGNGPILRGKYGVVGRTSNNGAVSWSRSKE